MVRQELFKKHNDFVAVAYIRVSAADTLKPGEDMDKSVFKTFHLQSLYWRRLIGVKGSEWAKSMINSLDLPIKLKPEISGEIKKPKFDKPKAKTVKAKAKEKVNETDDFFLSDDSV